MKKTHIRSYSINADGDIVVTDCQKGEAVDLSPNYESVERDRRTLRADAYLEVFRYENGDLTWVGSPNGHHVGSARSFSLLLRVFSEDVDAQNGNPRAF